MITLFAHILFVWVLGLSMSSCKQCKYYEYGDTIISTTTVGVPPTVSPTPKPHKPCYRPTTDEEYHRHR